MAGRRRRRNVIAKVPGQSGDIVAEGSRYGIYRDPDQFTIHRQGGAERVRVEGSEHHIHVHGQPRPEPEMAGARFEPEAIIEQKRRQISERINAVLTGELDSRLKFQKLKGVKFTPKTQALWQYFKGQKFHKHPLRLLRALSVTPSLTNPIITVGKPEASIWAQIFSSKKGGIRKWLRDRRNYKTVKAMREQKWDFAIEKDKPEFVAVKGNRGKTLQGWATEFEARFEKDMHDALKALKSDLRSGKINQTNASDYLQRYEQALEHAVRTFKHVRNEMLNAYEKLYLSKGPRMTGIPKYPTAP